MTESARDVARQIFSEYRPPEPETADLNGRGSERTWKPRDLSAVLDGTWQPPEPVVGCRDDSRGLFYPGRQHVIASEAEAGKTWLALTACATELARGNTCLYVDFEDDEGGIAGRLLTMGVTPKLISERFAYIRPEEPVGWAGGNASDLAEALGDLKPSLAVLDGITEAMTLHGLELKDNTDAATFGRLLPRRIAQSGAAVVALDHVVKNREAQGGNAIGAVHKVNALNGAMYLLEGKDRFGVGLTGRSRLFIRKDRPGQLRRHGLLSHDALYWYADLVVASHGEEFAEVTLPGPEHKDVPFRPEGIMAKIIDLLAANQGGLTGRAIRGGIKGRTETISLALEILISEGRVTVETAGRSRVHKLPPGTIVLAVDGDYDQ